MNNEPLANKLQAQIAAFQNNAQLMAMLERRRALEQQAQYEMQAREHMQIIYQNVMPALRTGQAAAAAAAAAGLQAAAKSPNLRIKTKTTPLSQVSTNVPGSESMFGTSSSAAQAQSRGQGPIQPTLEGNMGKARPQRPPRSARSKSLPGPNRSLEDWARTPPQTFG